MSRKRSRSKKNGFLAIPYSWNKLLGHNIRSYLKNVSTPHGGVASRLKMLTYCRMLRFFTTLRLPLNP